MSESSFSSGNQINITELDAGSPITEEFLTKLKNRDVEVIEKIIPLGGTGEDGDATDPYPSGSYPDGKSGIFHFNNLTINQTWLLEQGKPLIIFARGTVTINGTIDGNGKGALGGRSGNWTGNSSLCGGSGGGSGYPGGGGGGESYYGPYKASGGGLNGNQGGNGGTPVSRLVDIPMLKGDILGGAGGGGVSSLSILGGDGGGFIYIEALSVIVNSNAIIRCDGSNGNTAGSIGGGGGGGGVIWIRTKSYTNNGTVQANGGIGGAQGQLYEGGDGGAGVIYIERLP